MANAATSWIIVGAGYTGAALARALVERGADVVVTRRDADAATELGRQLGVRGVRADLADPESLAQLVPEGAIVVCLAPPGADPVGEIRHLIEASRAAARLIYVSSTGVYPPAHGAWVDESWPVAPSTASGRARAAAEAALHGAPISWIALRAAGIYGPGRGLAERLRAGSYRVIGDGASHVSRIHVEDLVAAILAAGASRATGFVNVSDDDPAPIGQVADELARRLGVPPPPRVPAASVSPEIAGMLTADRRIANQRLTRELGVVLRYPSWRDAPLD
ncbi:MAG: NAD(P)H-binding protein [Kofleriaceae bacterium]